MKKIKKFIVNIFLGLIPSKKLRKELRSKMIPRQDEFVAEHKIYGNIYLPIYNLACDIDSIEPEIYNKNGDKMRTFFIRDFHFSHAPNSNSKYFAWDRYNMGLNTHFYTHDTMLETMGNPKHKFGLLCESDTIVPDDYEIFNKHKNLNKDFDAIFTYSEKILNEIDNAKFFPSNAESWYGKPNHGGVLSDDAYMFKSKNISILSSDKILCDLHKLRIDLARKYKYESNVDTFGTFDGGPLTKVGNTLEPYRYSIVIENSISAYYFTERITNCFAAQTIPIYIGATKIDEFFNADGIIQIHPKDFDNIDDIIKQCCKEDYEQRLPAILDNYNRVQQYVNIMDYLYEKYLINKK